VNPRLVTWLPDPDLGLFASSRVLESDHRGILFHNSSIYFIVVAVTVAPATGSHNVLPFEHITPPLDRTFSMPYGDIHTQQPCRQLCRDVRGHHGSRQILPW